MKNYTADSQIATLLPIELGMLPPQPRVHLRMRGEEAGKTCPDVSQVSSTILLLHPDCFEIQKNTLEFVHSS